MEYKNILNFKTHTQFYKWLENNHDKETDCYLDCYRGKKQDNRISYIDAVYVALCYGWIDSTLTRINNQLYQRFSPRRAKTNWTELNKERCRWLIKHKYMKPSGLKSLPDLDKYVFDKEVIKELKKDKKVWTNFNSFPELYKRIRVSYVSGFKNKPEEYKKALANLIKNSKANKMYGQWNDNGRLK